MSEQEGSVGTTTPAPSESKTDLQHYLETNEDARAFLYGYNTASFPSLHAVSLDDIASFVGETLHLAEGESKEVREAIEEFADRFDVRLADLVADVDRLRRQ